MKELLVLSPETEKPTKTLDKNLKLIKSFNSGYLYKFELLKYTNIHDLLKNNIFKRRDCFICLGQLTEYGAQLLENEELGPRRKRKGKPTIKDKFGDLIVLDLDDHIIPGFNANKPIPSIRKWLKEKEIDCDVTIQITSGQKLKTEEARIRIYFETTTENSLNHRKAWSQGKDIQADGSVYTCSQPIYTAPPIIDGGNDPIKKRNYKLKGEERKFKLPLITPEKIKRYSGFKRAGAEYDLRDLTIPDEVIEGAVYRRYFMPLAFHYANLLKGDREAVFAIISSKALQVKSREFNAENTYAYIDDAIEKINLEKEEQDKITTRSDLEKESSKAPEFPEDLMEGWPHPWPMLYRNFAKVPRELEPALLIPTILSLNAFFLKNRYVTSYGRRPNMLFLNLTGSTGNKDVNSKNVIRDLDSLFKEMGAKVSLFSNIVTGESSISADTSFLQSFNDNGELFWINTEATRIFHQLSSSSNSSVSALSDKLIEVVDGHEITGKTKTGEKVKTISDPNAQVLFYAQPETIQRHINEDMVDSGLFGRALLSVLPDLKFDIETYNMFKVPEPLKARIENEFYEFYNSQKFNLGNMSTGKKTLDFSEAARDLMNKWARNKLGKDMASDETLQKVLSRLGNSAEQLYVIVLGICQLYDLHTGKEKRKEISLIPLIPLLDYWADTKIYAIKEFVATDIDPYANAIFGIIEDVIKMKIKLQGSVDRRILKEEGLVNRTQLFRILQSRSKLKRELSGGTNAGSDAVTRATRTLESMIKNKMIIKKEIGVKEYLGIEKYSVVKNKER
jgi:hypothetical protein